MKETYYAIACGKKICPIAISSDPNFPGDIENKAIEGILPLCVFSGKTIIPYNDSNPTELNIIFND